MTRWVLFTGQLRLSKLNIRSIKEHASTKITTKFIFILWDTTPKEEIQWVKKNLTNSEFFLIPEYEPSKELNKNHTIPVKVINWLRQFYAINQAFKLLEPIIQEEDQVIRSRTDLFVRNLTFENISDDIIVPGIKFGTGYIDYFAIMNKMAFKFYSFTYELMEQFYLDGRYLPPELVLGFSMSHKDISISSNKSLPRILLTIKNNRLSFRGSFLNENSQYFTKHEFATNNDSIKPNIIIRILYRLFDFLKDILFKIKLLFSNGK